MKRFLIIALLCLTFTSYTQAETMHELNFNAGVMLPQGTFKTYTDNGIYGHISIVGRVHKAHRQVGIEPDKTS